MSFWAWIGFFLISGVGAYFYYRALAEVRGAKSRDEIESFRDDELLAELQPMTTVSFGRPLPLAAGDEILVAPDGEGGYAVERVSVPVQHTRGLSPDLRRAFHMHQILAIAHRLHGVKGGLSGPLVWSEAADIEAALCAEWPGYSDRLAQVRRLATAERPLYPALTFRALPVSAEADGGQGAGKPSAAPRADLGNRAREQRRVKREESDRGLSIERVESEAESTRPWSGEQRDERAGRAEETPDMDLDLVRSDTPVLHAVRTDSRPPEHPASTEGIRYDEWDCAAGRYRRRYCRVIVHTAPPLGDGAARLREELAGKRQVVREVVRLFESLRPVPKRCRRQPDGDSIDLDAFVDQAIQMRLGGGFDEDIYEKHERVERSVAVTLLLDLSASTERWVGRRRAFEVGLETAALFAMGQRVLGDDVEILGFSGFGPARIDITNFKCFDEPWSDTVFDRLDQARPQAFTRLGAAIRHATASLSLRQTRQRLLIIVSDARPQDEDGYEGQYGWADTRKALDEARKVGIVPFCLTIDVESGPLLRLLFRNHYAIHLEAETLPLRLPKVFAGLTQMG